MVKFEAVLPFWPAEITWQLTFCPQHFQASQNDERCVQIHSNPKNGKRLSFIDHCPGSCCKDRTNAPCAQRRLSNKTEKDTERGDRFGSRFDQSRWNSPKLQSLHAGCSDRGTSTSFLNATTQMCCDIWKEPPNQQCLHLQHPVEHLPTAKVLKQVSEQRCSLGDDGPAALHQWTTEETRSAPAAHESSSPFCQAACWYAHAIWRKESLPWQILPAAWKRMIFEKMCYLLPVAYRYIEWPPEWSRRHAPSRHSGPNPGTHGTLSPNEWPRRQMKVMATGQVPNHGSSAGGFFILATIDSVHITGVSTFSPSYWHWLFASFCPGGKERPPSTSTLGEFRIV